MNRGASQAARAVRVANIVVDSPRVPRLAFRPASIVNLNRAKKLAAIPCARARALALACITAFLADARPARAVYAPIPPVEQGRVLTIYAGAASYYDTNIFGAATGAIGSMVCELQPSAVFNFSAADQTFLSASYQATLDYFDNRPGDKWLLSHAITGRLAHTFSPRLDGEINDTFQIIKNPESLLPGIGGNNAVANPDQSLKHNQLEARGAFTVTPRDSIKVVARAENFSYDNPWLSHDLNYGDYTAGAQAVHSVRENLQAVAEYRYEAVRYASDGGLKNKDSHALFAGADYAPSKITAYTARLGVDQLLRKGAPDATLPCIELAAKRDFLNDSHISAGYTFAVQETSDVASYTDTYAHHFFVNAQYGFTRQLLLTATIDWQPARLNGRAGVAPSIHETTLKAGAALTQTFKKHWSLSLTCDYDNINSDNPQRDLTRLRAGLRGRWVF